MKNLHSNNQLIIIYIYIYDRYSLRDRINNPIFDRPII